MLVGQDWGNPWDISMQDFMNKLALAGEGPIRGYMSNNKNPTDNNLVELFNELHYDITKPCQELFFTNFVLGYRNRGNHPEDKLLLQKEDWRKIKPYLSTQEKTI